MMSTRLRPLSLAKPPLPGRTRYPAARIRLASSHILATGPAAGAGAAPQEQLDLPPIEAKWLSKWQERTAAAPPEAQPLVPRSGTPLELLYAPHLRRPATILETLQTQYARTSFPASAGAQQRTVLDLVFAFSQADAREFKRDIACQGADLVRTLLVFRDPIWAGDFLSEDEIQATRRWFHCVRDAVRAAHRSYQASQRNPDTADADADADTGEAVGPFELKPDVEGLFQFITEEHLRYVQIPPQEPRRLRTWADADERRLWKATQMAILACTSPLGPGNEPVDVKRRLERLTGAVLDYAEARPVSCSMHYYAARVLLSLLAPLAPAFAEECWVALHYGWCDSSSGSSQARADGDGGENPQPAVDLEEASVQKMIREAESVVGRRPLPRTGRPETLPSIFDQPFPVAKLRPPLGLSPYKEPPADSRFWELCKLPFRTFLHW